MNKLIRLALVFSSSFCQENGQEMKNLTPKISSSYKTELPPAAAPSYGGEAVSSYGAKPYVPAVEIKHMYEASELKPSSYKPSKLEKSKYKKSMYVPGHLKASYFKPAEYVPEIWVEATYVESEYVPEIYEKSEYKKEIYKESNYKEIVVE